MTNSAFFKADNTAALFAAFLSFDTSFIELGRRPTRRTALGSPRI